MEDSPPTQTLATAQGTHEHTEWGSPATVMEAELC